MSLTLYFHPLSSFCWKVLVALYDSGTAFTPVSVDLSQAAEREALCKLWRPGRFPVLQAGDRAIAESSIIIEYLARHFAAASALVPTEPDAALLVRARDRLFDLDIHMPMQRIVGDRRRPADQRDPLGVAQARAQIRTGYAMVEELLLGAAFSGEDPNHAATTRPAQAGLVHGPWACGEMFTLADCAAAPALVYANMVEPIGDALPRTTAYVARLRARPSFARVLVEAEPYAAWFPRAE